MALTVMSGILCPRHSQGLKRNREEENQLNSYDASKQPQANTAKAGSRVR